MKQIEADFGLKGFAAADITIKQTNHNNINSGLDLDGIVEGLTDGPYEAIDKVAEGTHT